MRTWEGNIFNCLLILRRNYSYVCEKGVCQILFPYFRYGLCISEQISTWNNFIFILINLIQEIDDTMVTACKRVV